MDVDYRPLIDVLLRCLHALIKAVFASSITYYALTELLFFHFAMFSSLCASQCFVKVININFDERISLSIKFEGRQTAKNQITTDR